MAPRDQGLAVAAAAAHSINEDLSIILSATQMALRQTPGDHPARPFLLDIQSAAQRMAWHNSGLLSFARRHGARPSAASVDRILAELP